ncbi:unnamed protein product [Closterium sp. NIES-53]
MNELESRWVQVTPPPLDEPLEVSSGPAEGDVPAADDTPVAVDSGAIGGGGARGVGSEGVDGGGAVSRGAEPGGAEPGGIASGGDHQLPSHPHETLSPQQRHEWVVGRRADTGGTRSGGAEPGSADSGDVVLTLQVLVLGVLSVGVLPRTKLGVADSGGGGTRGTGAGGAEAAGAGGTGVGGKGAGGAGGSGTSGAGAGGTGARGTGGFSALGAAQPVPRRRFFWPQPQSSLPPPGSTLCQGRPLQFDTWLDDLQLYLLSDSRDSVSLFVHTSGAAPAPPATADTQDSADTVRHCSRSLLLACHCCSRPPATALLFPELSAFAIVEDLVSHLRASDARYHAATHAEFLDRNQPPMFITLYFIVTRLPDSLRSVRDHFLSLDPTSLTVDLLEQHLLAAETSAVAVGAPRGTPRTPFFEGCPPSPLTPSYASAAAAVDVLSTVARSTGSRSAEGPGAPCVTESV